MHTNKHCRNSVVFFLKIIISAVAYAYGMLALIVEDVR